MPQPPSNSSETYTAPNGGQASSAQDFPNIVVFTGDLVGSSKLSPAELSEAMRVLELAFHEVARSWSLPKPPSARFEGDLARSSPAFSSGWESRFSAFRGDSWQCVGLEPAFALRGALILRAHLSSLGRPFDTRISIGIGAGHLPNGSLNTASGPAFELSGHGLDEMKHVRRFGVAWDDPPREAPLIRAIFSLADEISRKWTPGQAKVFARLLVERPRPSQEALARSLGITQQSVAEHLSGGGDWALKEALGAMEGE